MSQHNYELVRELLRLAGYATIAATGAALVRVTVAVWDPWGSIGTVAVFLAALFGADLWRRFYQDYFAEPGGESPSESRPGGTKSSGGAS